jgi:hypothetical protein
MDNEVSENSDGADSTPRPASVDIGEGLSETQRRKIRTIGDWTVNTVAAAGLVLTGVGIGTLSSAGSPKEDHSSAAMAMSDEARPQPVRKESNQEQTRIEELNKTSRILTQQPDPSDNSRFSISGVLPEEAKIVVIPMASGKIKPVELGHVATGKNFKLDFVFPAPVKGYTIKLYRPDGTELTMDSKGTAEVLGHNPVLTRDEATKKAISTEKGSTRMEIVDPSKPILYRL